ncbi:unnamed protein product [Allacma fusca]|uniref:Uncharacterized protein n=1 Tax=Allacma fusca TaxID=39272 RepID=A0A8J2LTS9_9HEXA|nr:unnamed protein product [Allacma fusca]
MNFGSGNGNSLPFWHMTLSSPCRLSSKLPTFRYISHHYPSSTNTSQIVQISWFRGKSYFRVAPHEQILIDSGPHFEISQELHISKRLSSRTRIERDESRRSGELQPSQQMWDYYPAIIPVSHSVSGYTDDLYRITYVHANTPVDTSLIGGEANVTRDKGKPYGKKFSPNPNNAHHPEMMLMVTGETIGDNDIGEDRNCEVILGDDIRPTKPCTYSVVVPQAVGRIVVK